MSSPNNEHINLPQGPFGFPGMGDSQGEKKTHVPAGKKVQRNRRRDQQAKASRKTNRNS